LYSSRNGKSNSKELPVNLAELVGEWKAPGYLMVIGGSDRLDPEGTLPRLFLALVERVEANTHLRDVVLVTAATRHPEVLGGDYIGILTRLGVLRNRIHTPLIRNRDEAEQPEIEQLLAGAAGIFITGGDQYALTQVLDRTPAEEAIMEAYGKGAVVAGTSAGATAMGRPMIVAGGGSGELRHGMVQISQGLGWVGEDVIIDTHFGARGRFPRLASAVAERPEALGIGIDENTCILVEASGEFTVAGKGVVYVLDCGQAGVNTAPRTRSGEPISVGPMYVSILSGGSRYDLRRRELTLEMGQAAGV
jgi:cyanophycinase